MVEEGATTAVLLAVVVVVTLLAQTVVQVAAAQWGADKELARLEGRLGTLVRVRVESAMVH